MDQRSVMRGATNLCRQYHYTSILKRNRVTPTWGVSCESCHIPAGDWYNFHNKVGGDPDAKNVRWGDGKSEPQAQRTTRLDAARVKGHDRL